MGMDGENTKGRAYAFGVLSRIKPLRRPVLDLLLLSLRVLRPVGTARDLSFLHFAHWVVVPRARMRELRSERGARAHDYLLFLSSFNGDWDEYLQAFSRVLWRALDLVWTNCERWPSATRLSPFIEYVDQHELFADAFFNAYGDHNAQDIRGALELCERLEQFALELPGHAPGELRRKYERLLLDLGDALAA